MKPTSPTAQLVHRDRRLRSQEPGHNIDHQHYLQLGFGLLAIVNKAGRTLEETYHALTGRRGGYKAFTKLLAKFFPIGDRPPLPFDNPFPCSTARSAMCRYRHRIAGLPA